MSWGAVVILLLVVPGVAHAHAPLQGVNPFFNGFIHPLFVPPHFLLLLATGLLLGQQGVKSQPVVVRGFFVATFLGLILAWFSIVQLAEMFLLVASVSVSLLAVVSFPVDYRVCMLIAMVAGFAAGVDSSFETLSNMDRLMALCGSGVGIGMLMLYPMLLTHHFSKKHWQKIAVRVISSWIAASALLVLALRLKGT